MIERLMATGPTASAPKVVPRQPTIFLFLKFFEQRAWAEQFIKGHIHLNTVDYFTKFESVDADGRADRDEGLIWTIPPKRMVSVKIKIGSDELVFPPEAFAPPGFQIHAKWKSPQHLLCLYAVHTRDLEPPRTPQ